MQGEVAEWLKAHDSKSCMRQRIAGSNPALSAKLICRRSRLRAVFYLRIKLVDVIEAVV